MYIVHLVVSGSLQKARGKQRIYISSGTDFVDSGQYTEEAGFKGFDTNIGVRFGGKRKLKIQYRVLL
jgi:hypothetical protein